MLLASLLSETPISLKDYVSKMKEDQKYIYYASGKSLDYIKMLPQIEKFKKDGIEVLLLDKKIDEFAIMMMRDYDKKEFKNVADEASNELSKEEKELYMQLANKSDKKESVFDRFKKNFK